MSGDVAVPTAEWERKPHLLTVDVTKWGEMTWSIVCPYTTYDDRQPCRMGVEPSTPCAEYEDGNDCPHDGFSAAEVGHVHPIAGCWAIWGMNETGISWDESIRWVGEWPESATLPLEIWVAPDGDQGWTEIGQWSMSVPEGDDA